MDAVEYIKQARRMCKRYNSSFGCRGCALYGRCAFKLECELADELIKESVKFIEQWAKDNPQETRWTLLKKQYPKLKDDMKDQLCCRKFGYDCPKCSDMDCEECWDVPIEEAQE